MNWGMAGFEAGEESAMESNQNLEKEVKDEH